MTAPLPAKHHLKATSIVFLPSLCPDPISPKYTRGPGRNLTQFCWDPAAALSCWGLEVTFREEPGAPGTGTSNCFSRSLGFQDIASKLVFWLCSVLGIKVPHRILFGRGSVAKTRQEGAPWLKFLGPRHFVSWCQPRRVSQAGKKADAGQGMRQGE